jgi:hypothetical protein
MNTTVIPYDVFALWMLGFGSFTAIVLLIRSRASADPPLSSADAALLTGTSQVQFLIGFVCFLLHGARIHEDHAAAVLVLGIPLIVTVAIRRARRRDTR